MNLKKAAIDGLKRPTLFVLNHVTEPWSSFMAKKVFQPQLTQKEIAVVASVIKRKRPARLLVFGLGRDSQMWSHLNRGGTTLFIEDNEAWIEQCLREDPSLNVSKATYTTQRSAWRELLGSPTLDDWSVGSEVTQAAWDVIFVDAPQGWNDETPGRMQSIHWGARLLSKDGDLLIHDCHRDVEKNYANHYAAGMAFMTEVDRLRHYRQG